MKGSLTATTLIKGLEMAILKTRRQILPKPSIPMVTIVRLSEVDVVCNKKPTGGDYGGPAPFISQWNVKSGAVSVSECHLNGGNYALSKRGCGRTLQPCT